MRHVSFELFEFYYSLEMRLALPAVDGWQEIAGRLMFVTTPLFVIRRMTASEVGMLNCAPTEEDPICVPDSGKFPANKVPDFGTLASLLSGLFECCPCGLNLIYCIPKHCQTPSCKQTVAGCKI